VPSFARQTGFKCTTCHTAFPQLTPFGRQFKLKGYTMSDGKSHLPPVAAMLQAPTFTHTAMGQPGGAATDYARNDNFAVNQMSLFYAGRLFGPYAEDLFGEKVGDLLDHVGTFIQGTWDGAAFEWSWDNAEVRIASTATVADSPLVYGVYTNNNPTMEDLWNTTPAWGFPFSGSGLAPEPMAAPLIAGGLGQQVMGAGAYAAYTTPCGQLYGTAAGYTTLPSSTQRSLGVDPEGEAEVDGGAPYWRLAWSRDSGPHSFELGSYGLHANTWPGRMKSAGTDDITDVGFDGQYQFLDDKNEVTVLLNFIHEWEQWDASQNLGLASHNSDHLWSVTATTSYLYDRTYGGDIQYFHTGGNQDAMLYGTRTGSPESSGWIFQLDYLPFNDSGGPPFWPMSNVKFSLQYVHYQEFDGATSNYDGTGRDASDNDTLYFQVWLAF
jgi:hypothetical protein